jgi:hypothetical protein
MGRDYLSGAGGPSAGAAGVPLLGGGGGGGAGALSGGGVVATNAQRKAAGCRDRWWGLAYLVVLAIALAGGIYAAAHSNPDFAHAINPKYLSDPAHCPVPAEPMRRGTGLLFAGGSSNDDPAPPPPPPPAFSPKFFVAAASFYVALSVVGGVLLGVAAMALFRAKPRAAVYGAIALQVGLPVFGAVAVLLSGAPFAAAAPLLFVAFVVSFCYYLYREQLGLVAQLLGTAAQAVSHVWGVVVAAAGLQLAAAVVSLPLAASALFAYSNGRVVPSPLVASIVHAAAAGADPSSASATCLDASGAPVMCCSWRPDGWAGVLVAVCAVAVTWTSLLGFTLKTFIVSGSVARWYFAPANAGAGGGVESGGGYYEENGGGESDAPTVAAFKDAVGPSFGSCALAAWLLALIGWARSALAQLREQARDSFIAQLLLSCADVLYSILEQLSKFGVVFAAITGDAFLPAARQSTALLSRNLLDTVAVWVFPANILGFTNLALGVAWAGLAGVSSYRLAFLPMAARAAAAAGGGDAASTSVAVQSAVAVAVVAFAFGFAALSFLASVLLSAVDAVYLCFAIDRDRALVTREEVHAVMVLLPAANKGGEGPGGGIVEHPGGGLAFGGAERGGVAAAV